MYDRFHHFSALQIISDALSRYPSRFNASLVDLAHRSRLPLCHRYYIGVPTAYGRVSRMRGSLRTICRG